MMSIIRRISTFLFLCFFVLNSSAAQRLSFNHLSIEDGLANNSVRTMFQDQEGYLWFGTLNGLSRYDGQQFRTFSYSLSDSTSISNNKVREIFQDGLGYLWITTYDNNAHRFDPHTETFINIPAELGETAKNLPVHFVVETSPGEVWIYFTSQGCARINSDVEGQGITVSRFDTGNGLLSNSLYGIWGDSKGQVWISTEAGLQRFTSTVKSNGKARSSVFFTNPAKQVDAFCVGSDEVWAGTLSGEVYRIIGSWVEKVWESSTGAEVRDIHILQSGDIIAATAQGVLLIDGKQRKGKLFNIYNSQLNSNNIFSVYPDSKGDCWLVTDQRGVTRFQPQNLQFTHFPLNPEIRLSIVEGEKQVFLEDMNGDVWVGIYGGGISRFNRNTEQFEQYLHDENNPASLSSNLILSIFHDRSGNLLAGTYKRGVNIINLEQGNFHSVKGPAGPADDFSNEVRAVFEDHRGWIWTGNKRGHVVVYNQVFEKLFTLSELLRGSPINTGVYAFEEDGAGRIWIGTKGDGLYILENLPESLADAQVTKPGIVHVTSSTDRPFSLLHNDIFDLHYDRWGQMWIALYHGGVNVIEKPLMDGQRVLQYRRDPDDATSLSDNRVRCFLEDHSGNLWIGTSNGLNVVGHSTVNKTLKSFKSITRSGLPGGLTYNDIISIFEDSEQHIWVATLGGGLNRLENDGAIYETGFSTLLQKDGLSGNMVLGIAEDLQKNLWVSTDFGLNKVSLQTGRIECYYAADGLYEHSFTEGNGLLTSSGKLLFGHISGMVWFDPSAITKSDRKVPVVLTGFKINGEEQREKLNTARQIWGDSLQALRLRHNENFLTFEFAALDYKAPNRVQYAFKLDGHEAGWNRSGNLNAAIYRDLPAGDYTFRLKASNSDGIWVNPEKQLAFTIAAPPWKTPWAYSIYLVLILGFLFLLQRILMERFKLKQEVILEKQLTDDKLKFYTSISHEFKTPLALIMGPVEELLSKRNLDENLKTPLKMVHRNTRRLQVLIDQLMDFRKLQKGFFQTENTTGNLVGFLNEIYLAFVPVAHKQKIVFTFRHTMKELIVSIDFNSLEKIIFNLLSNAFKHTPGGKKISLDLKLEDDTEKIEIAVVDEGEGIDDKDLPHIFERFNPGKRSRWTEESSTGIGLSLCMELVTRMGGTLTAKSTRNFGSTFLLSLPFIPAANQSKTDTAQPEIHYTRKYINVVETGEQTSEQRQHGKREGKILIVEDNTDMQLFLASHFSSDYAVLRAGNGQAGIDMARKENPDLIVCDVMMPEMDGLEMTRILKNDFNTSHIPVILLTARSLDEHKIEGLETGADDYVVKPFNMDFLQTRIRNLLKQRKLLRERYRTDIGVAAQSLVSARPDQEFIEKVEHLIQKKMTEPDFSVDLLLEDFSFGRTAFYKKVKGISGYSPNEFIRIVRMKKAGELLLQQSGNSVTGVAFEVGYSDADYFSRQFKKFYGVTPSEYQRENR